MRSIGKYVKKHRPRCIASLPWTIDESPGGSAVDRINFKLLPDGVDPECWVFGYDLRQLNERYTVDLTFVSPLYLQRTCDSEQSLILDTDVHGYHGELKSSAKLRGTGAPELYSCGACSGDRFFVQVTFDYASAAQDLWDDEPDIPIEDYFTGFTLTGSCVNCGSSAACMAELDL